MIGPDGAPTQPVWHCSSDSSEAPPLPVPITLDDGFTYFPGIGTFNREGEQVIGLPASHFRVVARALISGDFFHQLEAGEQFDAEIEGNAQA